MYDLKHLLVKIPSDAHLQKHLQQSDKTGNRYLPPGKTLTVSLKPLQSLRITPTRPSRSSFPAFPLASSSVQLLSRVRLFSNPWTAACQASRSITNSQSLLKLMSIESVMPPNHLISCHPLLLPPSMFPSIRVFSNESALRVRWPKYWSFSFSISPSKSSLAQVKRRSISFVTEETNKTLGYAEREVIWFT